MVVDIGPNATTVLLALIAVVPTVIAGLAYRKTSQTHQLVNSRMTELLDLTKTASHAEGVVEGVTGVTTNTVVTPTPNRLD